MGYGPEAGTEWACNLTTMKRLDRRAKSGERRGRGVSVRIDYEDEDDDDGVPRIAVLKFCHVDS